MFFRDHGRFPRDPSLARQLEVTVPTRRAELPVHPLSAQVATLLGFLLLPRLKAIHSQTLYRPEIGKADAYSDLQLILGKPIDWDLVRQQYDQMIKYAAALRLRTAETKAILRRFTKHNVQHPTYKSFAELGKAIKTIFLNVVEQWNGATDFVFFARRGEMTSNRREDHEISMLSLHLIQNCMICVTTLMIQKLLAQPH